LANNSSTWLYPHNGFWVDPIIGTSTTNGSYMNCTYSVPMYLANGDNIQLIEQGASVTITHNHDESHFGVIFMG
jgi:ADP-ribosylglycohydrolase